MKGKGQGKGKKEGKDGKHAGKGKDKGSEPKGKSKGQAVSTVCDCHRVTEPTVRRTMQNRPWGREEQGH